MMYNFGTLHVVRFGIIDDDDNEKLLVLAASDTDVKFYRCCCNLNRITHNMIFVSPPFAQIRLPSHVTVRSLALLTCLSLHPCAGFKRKDIFGVYNT